MTRVVIADIAAQPTRDLGFEREILGDGVKLELAAGATGEAAVVAACRDAEVVITDLAPLTSRVLGDLGRCRLISIAGTGYSNVDLDAARAAGIAVCAITEYCTDEVADHTLLLILALCRQLTTYHRRVQAEHAWEVETGRDLERLRGLTLGIVGYGRIGRAVAARARGFGMRLIANTHHPAEGGEPEPDVRFCDLETLLGESDVICLCCGMAADNDRLIDAAAFAQMQRHPILVNCARGELIDEAALLDALESGRISGAGLDVLRDEPPDLATSVLAGRDNVILTPHVGWYSKTAMLESRRISAQNVRHFIDGRHDLVDRYVLTPPGAA